jgi:hypothetical protein
VQQRAGRLAGHARVAVGRAGDHALEQPEDGAHPGLLVQRRDEVHLRRAGIGEAHLDAGRDEGLEQAVAHHSSSATPC